MNNFAYSFVFVGFIRVSLHSTTTNPYPGQDITLSCNLSTNIITRYNAYGSASSYTSGEESSANRDEQTKRFRELISTHFLLNINWYHNGKLIDFDHRKRRSAEELLLIRDFHGPEDNGIYQCSIRLTAPDYDDESFMSAIHINAVGRFLYEQCWNIGTQMFLMKIANKINTNLIIKLDIDRESFRADKSIC